MVFNKNELPPTAEELAEKLEALALNDTAWLVSYADRGAKLLTDSSLTKDQFNAVKALTDRASQLVEERRQGYPGLPLSPEVLQQRIVEAPAMSDEHLENQLTAILLTLTGPVLPAEIDEQYRALRNTIEAVMESRVPGSAEELNKRHRDARATVLRGVKLPVDDGNGPFGKLTLAEATDVARELPAEVAKELPVRTPFNEYQGYTDKQLADAVERLVDQLAKDRSVPAEDPNEFLTSRQSRRNRLATLMLEQRRRAKILEREQMNAIVWLANHFLRTEPGYMTYAQAIIQSAETFKKFTGVDHALLNRLAKDIIADYHS